jgi:sulfate adenylyltransferase subunit 1
MIVKELNLPVVSQDVDIMLCWLNAKGPQAGTKYYLRQTTREVRAVIKEVIYKMDINKLQRLEEDKEIKMNDIVRVKVRTTQPVVYDAYRKNRYTGSIILVDETTNETVAAGMIIE